MPLRPVAAAAVLAAACAHSSTTVPLTLVLRGDADQTQAVRSALVNAPPPDVEVRITDLLHPLQPPEAPADLPSTLDQVRAAYDQPSWQKCLAPLDEPSLVPRLLAAEQREGAAQVLFWRAACRLLKGDEAGAKDEARALATRGLEIPNERADPAVARLLHQAQLEVARRASTPVHLLSTGPELTIAVDGRARLCTTPCPVELRQGAHTLRVEADGYEPQNREVSVGRTIDQHFSLARAAPGLAERQWVTHWSTSGSVDSAPSLHLLADATRARNVVLLVAQGAPHAGLRGALTVDGIVTARAEREGDAAAAAASLVRELLISSHVIESVPLWRRPAFWVAIGGVAVAAVAVTWFVTSQKHRTEVHF